MIKNIIFDWSGVINDNLMTVYNAAMIIFEKYGAGRISLEELKTEWEQPYMLFYNKYLPGLSREQEVAAYSPAYKTSARQFPPRLYPHIDDTLHKFKKAGIKMVVISSDPVKNLKSDIREFKLQGIFSDVYGEVHDKTNVVQGVIDKHRFKGEETIFIGDTTHEIEAGKSAGTKTAGVTWGFQNENKIKSANPDYIISNLKDLELILGLSSSPARLNIFQRIR
jgi:phosphoglycolate phosphatase-like HAD superfamily hydrolase